MAVLVLAEHDGVLKPATLNAVAAAAELSKAGAGDIHVLVAGSGCKPAADAAAQIPGVAKVLLADDAAYGHGLAENVAPLLAALLDVMQISDIAAVVSQDTFVRPIYAGNALATVQSKDGIKVITVRGTAFPPGEGEGGSAPVGAVSG